MVLDEVSGVDAEPPGDGGDGLAREDCERVYWCGLRQRQPWHARARLEIEERL